MKNITTVLLKELKDIWRDKRSRSAMLFGPFFSVFLTFVLFGVIGTSVKKASKSTIHVVGTPSGKADEAILKALKSAETSVETVKSAQEGQDLIKKSKARIVLDFGSGLDASFAANKPAKIDAYFEEGDQKAEISLSVISAITSKINEATVKQVFSSKGVDPSFSTPVTLERKQVKVGETSSSSLLTQIIPYLIVIWAFYGGFGVSSDIVAGEKERQTLETLLISPLKRSEVAIGKLLALFVAGFSAAATSLIAVFAVMLIKPPGTQEMLEKGLGLTPTGGLIIVTVIVPTVLLFASGLMAISAFAKNTREAQTYLAQASFLVVIPAMFSQIIGLTDADKSRWVSFVPVLNTANTIRQAMDGKYDLIGVAITVVLGIALASIGIAYSVRAFNREEVLTRI
jgi:sodium transport system permease protein